jgi:hypothetical protein
MEVNMRSTLLLLMGATFASCTTAPEQTAAPSPKAEHALANLVSGKVARPAVSCLPNYHSNDMTIVDGRTLGFKVGTGTVYIMHLTPGCEMVGSGGPYALLNKQYGGMGLCRGDIQQVIDTTNRITIGSCTIGEVVPYTRS